MARHDDGFTLMEIMAVLLIIGILTLIAIASYANSSSAATRAACLHNQRVLNDAVVMYEAGHNGDRPTGFDELRPYVRDVDDVRFCPQDRTPLVLDPDTADVTCPNHPSE